MVAYRNNSAFVADTDLMDLPQNGKAAGDFTFGRSPGLNQLAGDWIHRPQTLGFQLKLPSYRRQSGDGDIILEGT
jgi:hypothetical protein